MRLGLANDALSAVVEAYLVKLYLIFVKKELYLELVLFKRLFDDNSRRIGGLVVGMRGNDGVLFLIWHF